MLEVSRAIDALYDLAFKEKAFAATVQLHGSSPEQVEEEQNAREILAKLDMVKDDPASLLDLDRDLGRGGPSNARLSRHRRREGSPRRALPRRPVPSSAPGRRPVRRTPVARPIQALSAARRASRARRATSTRCGRADPPWSPRRRPSGTAGPACHRRAPGPAARSGWPPSPAPRPQPAPVDGRLRGQILVHAVERHGDDRRREVPRQDRCALLERPHRPVDRPFALREEHEHAAVAQAGSHRPASPAPGPSRGRRAPR